jgi:hypothetical protein
MTRVSLVCLDDDDQGKPLEVLWELELRGLQWDDMARAAAHVRVALDDARREAGGCAGALGACVADDDDAVCASVPERTKGRS